MLVSPRHLAGPRAAAPARPLLSNYQWLHHQYGQRLIITSPDGPIRIGRDEPQRSWQVVASTDSLGAPTWRAHFSPGVPDEIVEEFCTAVADSCIADTVLDAIGAAAAPPTLTGPQIIEPFINAGWHCDIHRGGATLLSPDTQATAEVLRSSSTSNTSHEEDFGRRLPERSLNITVHAPGARWSAQFTPGTPNELLCAAAAAIARPSAVPRDELRAARLSLPLLTLSDPPSTAVRRATSAAARQRKPGSPQGPLTTDQVDTAAPSTPPRRSR